MPDDVATRRVNPDTRIVGARRVGNENQTITGAKTPYDVATASEYGSIDGSLEFARAWTD
jgi:hypothetical protein